MKEDEATLKKISKCCGEEAVQTDDKYFCGGVDGCGEWCETDHLPDAGKVIEDKIEEFREFGVYTNNGVEPIMDIIGVRIDKNGDEINLINWLKQALAQAKQEQKEEDIQVAKSFMQEQKLGNFDFEPIKDEEEAAYCLTCEAFLYEEACRCMTVKKIIEKIIEKIKL